MKRMRTCRWAMAVMLAMGWTAARGEDLRIQSFDGTGRLTFNTLNDGTNYDYRVEWAPSPSGPWTSSWEALASIVATGSGIVTCSVPMCYRVVAMTEPITYTITYNGNGNTGGATSNSSHTYGVSKTLTANGFTRTGYFFAGWTTSAGGTAAYSDGQSVLNLAATQGTVVTLYAKWTALPPTYAVTYSANGATSGTAPDSQTKTHDVALTLAYNSGNLAKTGYSFAGWNTAAHGLGTAFAAGGSYTINAALALYANWTPITYTVVYIVNESTGGSTASSSHTYGVSNALTANGFTRTGYTFAGWATSTGGAVVFSDGQSVLNLAATQGAVVILYAKWTPITYTVTYDGNGSTSGSTADSSHTYGVSNALTANGFTRTGYMFAGWATSAGGEVAYSDGQSVMDLAAIQGAVVSLYAKWTPVTYTVAYNGNGSSGGSTVDSSHTYDVSKTLTANGYTRTGYMFAGWATSVDGTVAYSDGQSVQNLAATQGAVATLYAKWIPIPTGMVLIPGGTNSGTDPDFGAYSLTVSPLFMDATEVTKAKWDEVYTWAIINGYSFDHAGSGKAANHPVHRVSWYDVVKWCNARSQKEGRTPCYTVSGNVYKTGQSAPACNVAANGYRLPTNVEWEYAARGGLSGKRFPWGDTIQHARANYYSEGSYSYDTSPTRGKHPDYATGGSPYTSPAGAFAPNGYGLYDMAGNVWEWCNDSSGSYRAIRGGCWDYGAYDARCRVSHWGDPGYADGSSGFRAVCR